MKALLEQIRLVRKVIEGNIYRYNEVELRSLYAENQTCLRECKKSLLVGGICVTIAVILAVFLFNIIGRIKNDP